MRRPKSICKHAGCGALIDTPGTCDKHKKDRTGWYQTSTKTASERGYDASWRRVRKLVLARDCGLCQTCKRAGVLTVTNIVDHVKPKSQGGTNDPSNLEAICHGHHVIKTASERNL